MRKLSLQQYAISLDGYICQDGTGFYRWWESLVDEEFERYFVTTLGRAHTHIMGRKTYLDMGAFWPKSNRVRRRSRRRDRRHHERPAQGRVFQNPDEG